MRMTSYPNKKQCVQLMGRAAQALAHHNGLALKTPSVRAALQSRRGGEGVWGAGGSAVSEAEVVYREDGSMLSFDLISMSGQGQDVAIVTDQECLVFLQRPSSARAPPA